MPVFRKIVSKYKIPLIIGMSCLVLYTVLGFFVLPLVIRSQAVKLVSEYTKRAVSIEKVKVNPYAMSLGVSNFSMDDMDGKPFASFDTFYVNVQLSSILKSALVVKTLQLKSPYVRIIRGPKGDFNFADLIAPISEKDKKTTSKISEPSTDLFSLIIDELILSGGRVELSDNLSSEKFSTTLDPIELAVSEFNTRMNSEANFTLSVKTESDETINCEGSFSIDPFRTEGTVDLKRIVLKKYKPYYQKFINFRVAEGALDLKTGFRYHAEPAEPVTELRLTTLSLDSLKLADRDNQEVFFSVPALSVENLDLDVNSQTVAIGAVRSKGGFILCRRSEDGVLNLVQHFVPPGSPKADTIPEQTPNVATPWAANLNNLLIENYTLQFQDLSPTDPVNIKLDGVTLEAKGISTQRGQTAHTSLAMRWGQKGGLALKGPVVIQPLSANLEVLVDHFDIRSIQPYFTDKVKLIITDGNFNADGKLKFELKENGSPALHYQGKAWSLKFSSIDKKENNDFVKWESLYVLGMDISLNPTRILIDDISLNGYYNQLTINPDGTININTVLPFGQDQSEKTSEKSETPEAGSEKTAFPEIRINTVNLQGGTIKFLDKLNKPNFETDLLELGGRISGLSSDKNARADVFIKGVQNDFSPLEIKGKINPLAEERFADIKMSFKDIELSPFSPYSSRYLGHILEKGKLNLDLEYKILGNELSAKNLVYIDQLTLGDKVDSPDATSLPVKLGIALLKDRDDRIVLDLPVTGNLDDPKFSIGKIVWKMILNLFTKIITSPFAAISSMFGGGEELSFVDFDYGSSELTDLTKKKLDTLINALFERPALDLEIEGEVNPEEDREGLRNNRFRKRLKAEKVKEMAKGGSEMEGIDLVSLAPEEYEHYLKKVYDAADFPKPRDAEGKIKELPPSEMEKLLITNMEITQDDLRLLAHARASKVKEYILESGKVEAERVFVVEPKIQVDSDDKKPRTSRVNFKLK